MDMSVLTHDEILRLIREGLLSIEPFSEDIVRENGVDLRVGTEYAIYAFDNQVIDPCELESARHLFSIVEAKDCLLYTSPSPRDS